MAIALHAVEARAAVRECYPSVSSEIGFAETELEAKRKAIEQWQAKAEKFGVSFKAWRLAVEKTLKCFPKEKGFECVAVGQPCVIRQNPSKKTIPADPKAQAL